MSAHWLTVTSSGEAIASAALPASTGDTVYIRAVDTDATYGHVSRDTLYVDHLYLEMVGTISLTDTISISDVALRRLSVRGKKEFAEANVLVLDQRGLPVAGVLVEGQFSGASFDLASGLTDVDGHAVLQSKALRGATQAWCFEVTELQLATHAYDPSRNRSSSACEAASAKLGNLPTTFALQQNVPNPFNPSTTIEFALPEAAAVTLSIYNALGQVVNIIHDRPLEAGIHQVVWDGTDFADNPVASGLYFYRLQAGDFAETRKMLLLK
ncbi:MAG: FlgD immunoglobulin-like domain containing protein [bacterium]